MQGEIFALRREAASLPAKLPEKEILPQVWYVYILECADGTLYTGMTNHLVRRLAAHNAGKGAKYTKTRRPVHLRYSEKLQNQSQALRREAAIKKLSHAQKRAMCENFARKGNAVSPDAAEQGRGRERG